MNKQDSVDEVFDISTPRELDIVKIEKYFNDLSRAVTRAGQFVKYFDEEDVKAAVDDISNELSWIEDDVYKLIAFYNDAQDVIAAYRSLVEDRMTADEVYEHKTILIRNKLEATK